MADFYTNVKVLGNNILYRGIQNNKRVQYKHEYNPKYFIHSNRQSDWTTLNGVFVEPLEQGSIKEAKDFLKRYEDIENFEIYGDIGFDVQFIAEKFKGEINWELDKLSIQIIDIETRTENGFPNKIEAIEEILLISMFDLNKKTIKVFTSTEYTGEKFSQVEELKDFSIDVCICPSEYSLLRNFISYWNDVNIDVISGWNIDGFDIAYIINRINRILGDSSANQLSPWGRVTSRTSKDQFGNEDTVYDILGVESLDYMELYKKYTYTKQESYSLEFICQEELGLGKLDHSEFNTFKEFYETNWNKFFLYNLIDTVRVFQLEEKLKLLDLGLTVSYLAKVNYEDIFSASKVWDSVIYNILLEDKKVIPPRSKQSKSEQFEGAYVKEPVPGFYEWVVSFDATALYPSIMQAWNISPETFVGLTEFPVDVEGFMEKKYLLNPNYCTAANGSMYSKEKNGLLPSLIDIFAKKRREAKNKMLSEQTKLEEAKKNKISNKSKEYKQIENNIAKFNNEQMAIKILNNSLYGCLGLASFRYFKLDNARAITLTGQYIIKSVGQGLSKELNKLLGTKGFVYDAYSDTDSIISTIKPLVEKFYKDIPDEKLIDIVDKICKEKITPIINSYCDDLQSYTNVRRNTIEFKREMIAKSGILLKKKKYVMNMLDNEGVRYAKPKLKIMGLEIVRSSTPKIIREKLRESVSIILNEGEDKIQEYIENVKKDFKTFSIEEISFPRGVNGIEKYSNSNTLYSLGCPIHTKGSILYNHKISELKLHQKYEKIREGDSIKFCYLVEPNPLKDIVIAFPAELPKEFGLHKFVDYDKQFEKTFLDPLISILNAIGWSHEKTNSIDDFFS